MTSQVPGEAAAGGLWVCGTEGLIESGPGPLLFSASFFLFSSKILSFSLNVPPLSICALSEVEDNPDPGEGM